MQQSLRQSAAPTQPLILSGKGDEGGIDILAILRMFWAGKWIIVLSTVFCLAIAYFQASQLTPTYRASAKVMFDLEQRNVADLDEVVTSNFQGAGLRNQLEVLRSTALIERVVDKLNLTQNPEFNPSLVPQEPSRFDWLTLPPEVKEQLQALGLIQPAPPPPDPLLIERRRRLGIIRRVQSSLGLAPVRGSTVIEISFVSTNPRTAAQIANTVANQYIVEQLEGKLEATRSATEWLSDRVTELQKQVETSEARVAEVDARLVKLAGQTLEITKARLAELSGLLGSARARDITLTAQVDRLRAALEREDDIASVPEFREASLISTYRGREGELLSQRSALLNNVSETHPTVRRIDDQIADLRGKMRTEAGRVVDALEVQRDAARTEGDELAIRVRELEEKALTQSASEIELRQAEREAQAARLLYENFLGRLQETSQQESLQTADARVITPAEVPRGAMSGSKRNILAAGGGAGILLGLGLVFLLHKLNNTFRSPGQVEEETGIRVLGSVPALSDKSKRREIIAYFREKPNSSLAEAIRNLRTSILFADVDNPPKAVMMTSSIPQEGKSTTSVLLALTSQQMGRKTIIVDCDLRLPAVATLLDFDRDKPGILSLINETATLEEAISVEPESGLHILMVRPNEARSAHNAADILASQKFKALIEELKSRYDLVILDTPPALVVSDARILAKSVDGVIYSVKWDSTARGAVAEGVKEIRSIGAPILGAVMTLVNESKAAKYSYDGYGYGYYRSSYRNYYVD